MLATVYLVLCITTSVVVGVMLAYAVDSAKKACFADAKRLCPAEVKAMNRKRAEICLSQKIAQTTPQCHKLILIEREKRAAKSGN